MTNKLNYKKLLITNLLNIIQYIKYYDNLIKF